MTPQESIDAYEAWCTANKSFLLKWKENGVWTNFDAHIPNTIVTKINEVLPLIDDGLSLNVEKIPSIPTYEGYKEWLTFNP